MTSEITTSHIASVMIVDDSRVQRLHGAALCREIGIPQVHEASNGGEALAMLAAMDPQPSLLIIDLEMPTMNGPELLEKLEQQGIDIPIIVASSRDRALLESVQAMGSVIGLQVMGALQKPLCEQSLREALLKFGEANLKRKRSANLPISAEELAAAVERQEIGVHYQPKVDIRTGKVHAVEALARWQHPTHGHVPPDQFIALAERSNLIHPLTIQVMSQAILQTASWHAHGLDLSVALNLSPLLLERADLPQEIASLQKAYGLAAEQIVLEVTESSLVTQLGVALGVLVKLRLRGFGLSIDDYGTGFSSMQQLARVPFTELKIDRAFVNGAYERKNLQVLLRSALDLAAKLGLSTVAEGIETLEDWRLLQEFGCTSGQGYFLSKPMAADQFESWLEGFAGREAELAAPTASQATNS